MPPAAFRPLLSALLLIPGAAQAAGYYTTGVGIRAMGRGAAFTVGADDLSAQYYNPAALTRIRSQVTLQLAGVHQSVRFKRADETDLSFEEIENDAPPFPVPNLGGAWSFGLDDFTLALGMYTPYAPMLSYPEGGPQRYALTESTVIAVSAGPSAAYRFADRLSLGVGLAWTMLQVDQSLAAIVHPTGTTLTEDAIYDVGNHIFVRDPFAITWNAGLLYESPDGFFAAGLAYVPAVSFHATGTLESDFSQNHYHTEGFGEGDARFLITDESASTDSAYLDVRMPHILRGGVLLRPKPSLELELDVAWQGWSSLDSLSLEGAQLEVATNSDPLVIDDVVALPLALQNAWSFRLGAEADLKPRLTARMGLLFETSAVPEEYQGVLMPDGTKFGYGVGASVWLAREKLALDLGFSQAFVPERELERSTIYQVTIDPLAADIGTGKYVGDGTFAAHTTIFGLGLNWVIRPPDGHGGE